MAILRQLHPVEIMPCAEILVQWLKPACKTNNGRCNEWDLINGAVLGSVQIWVAELAGKIRGVAVTSIIPYAQARACKLHIGTARKTTAAEWREAMGDLMAWAKRQGCELFEADARFGWERVFAGILTKSHVFLEARL